MLGPLCPLFLWGVWRSLSLDNKTQRTHSMAMIVVCVVTVAGLSCLGHKVCVNRMMHVIVDVDVRV